jgi:hypothetical protein
MQKLFEHLNEIKKEFHLRCGHEFGFSESQSEAHFDLTTKAAMEYLQGLAMSGKISEIQEMVKEGPEMLRQSQYYNELIDKCCGNYYALEWNKEDKTKLAETALAFAIAGLKQRFVDGGYSNDTQGVLKFVGLDSGMLGLMGKMGGMFNMFRKK